MNESDLKMSTAKTKNIGICGEESCDMQKSG